jgi:zinc transporter ZupT
LYTEVILKSFFVVISAVTGVISVFLLKLNHEKLCSLISFSAGALFGAAVFSLLPEAFENLNIIQIILSAGLGYLIFWLISKYYFHVCPACSASHFDEQTTKRFSEIVLLMITALSFHSFFDGVALTSGFEHGNSGSNSVFVAIAIHKFPEGLALASLMLGAAYTRGKTLLYVVLVELTTVIGAFAGILLASLHITEFWFGIIIAHIAGGFIFLGIHAVKGELFEHHTRLVVTYFSIGSILILISRLLSGGF